MAASKTWVRRFALATAASVAAVDSATKQAFVSTGYYALMASVHTELLIPEHGRGRLYCSSAGCQRDLGLLVLPKITAAGGYGANQPAEAWSVWPGKGTVGHRAKGRSWGGSSHEVPDTSGPNGVPELVGRADHHATGCSNSVLRRLELCEHSKGS